MQSIEKHTVELPLSVFGKLKVKEGDKLEGVVSADNKAVLSVITLSEIESKQTKEQGRAGIGFGTKWRGKFKNPSIDPTKDARLDYILNRRKKATS